MNEQDAHYNFIRFSIQLQQSFTLIAIIIVIESIINFLNLFTDRMNEKQKKQKLLNRYILPINANSHKKQKNEYNNNNNVWLKDDEDMIVANRESASSESEEVEQKRARIDSDSQQNENGRDKIAQKKQKQRKNKQRQQKKQKKLHKKLKKTFGLDNDDQVQQFLTNLQIQGIEKSEILQYLKQNKTAIIKKQGDQGQNAQKKSKKKDKKKKKDKEGQDTKFSKFQKSQSSDFEIPNQVRAKTIYRNKDGTIKDCSIKEEKEKHKNSVFQRLAQWQRGMKKQESDHQPEINEDLDLAKNNKIWDDPMKRWQGEAPKKFLTCKFEGAPNRYGIKPGYRWDGVIRGNGFENRYLQEINLRKAKKAQEHLQYMKNL